MQQLADGCWCGPSYFRGSDGIGRVVSSAGDALQIWQIQTSPAPQLVAEATSCYVQQSEQDPGFFTVVSSNGTRLSSAIIWAVARPTPTTPLMLYAFAAAPAIGTLDQLYSAPAGQWPHLGGNANLVPVVANGKVYVAAYKSLMIFGPNGSTAASAAAVSVDLAAAAASLPPGATQRVSGTLLAIDGTPLTLLTRTSQIVTVDVSGAVANERVQTPIVGQAYTALGAGPSKSSEIFRPRPSCGQAAIPAPGPRTNGDSAPARSYEGDLWKRELENVMMPMIVKSDVGWWWTIPRIGFGGRRRRVRR